MGTSKICPIIREKISNRRASSLNARESSKKRSGRQIFQWFEMNSARGKTRTDQTVRLKCCPTFPDLEGEGTENVDAGSMKRRAWFETRNRKWPHFLNRGFSKSALTRNAFPDYSSNRLASSKNPPPLTKTIMHVFDAAMSFFAMDLANQRVDDLILSR